MAKNWIDTLFRNQYGIDIETVSFERGRNQIVQIGIQKPSGSLFEINIQQQPGYKFGHFHQQPGRLVPYYQDSGIDLLNPRKFELATDEEGRSFYRSVTPKERAQKLVRQLTINPSGRAPNYIIHNANFEIRHFDSWFGEASPFGFSEEYLEIATENRKARAIDTLRFESGLMSGAQVRANDISRQMKVYNQVLKDARAGGKILDSMELAKTLNALGQKKGIIPGAELTVGTSVDFLAETLLGKKELHRAAQDVALQNTLAPKLVEYIEDIKRDSFSLSKLPKNHPIKKWAHVWQTDALGLKVGAQTRALEQAIESLNKKGYHKYASGRFTASSYEQFTDFLGKTGAYKPQFATQGMRVADYGVAPEKIVRLAEKKLSPYHKALLKEIRSETVLGSIVRSKPTKAVFLGAGMLGLGAVAYNAISGKDDDYNTIEGLRHGWFGSSRKHITDFGSGYIAPTEYKDPTPIKATPLAIGAAGIGSAALLWNKPFFGMNTNRLTYAGPVPQGISRATFLGREKATFGDVAYNAIRRLELAAAGIPKAFSASALLSPGYLKDTELSLDLTKKTTRAYTEYLNQLTGKNLPSIYREVSFRRNKLYGTTYEGAEEVLLKEARMYQRIHDPNISKSVSQFAKSYENIALAKSKTGYRGIGREVSFLIGGGDDKVQAGMRAAHAYAHETLSKYLRLVDDPIKAFSTVFPDVAPSFTSKLQKAAKKFPKFGVGGEKFLVGTLPQLLVRHASTALPKLLAIPFAYGMVDWALKEMFPEEGGVKGVAGEIARIAHLTYAEVSEISGLTALRKDREEEVKGSTGALPFLGLTLAGGLTGAAIGAGRNVFREATSGKPYEVMLSNMMAKKQMRGFLKYIPTMKGEYTRLARYWKMGTLAGAAIGLPLLLMGLGSEKTRGELEAEYSGEKEVAIKKGRWWEFGQTPWKGGKTMYYRPNWYAKMKADAKVKSIYGENISPLKKAINTFLDPYWLEEQQYEDRPYPITGPGGEGLGIFGPLWARTIGRVIKPPAYMHPGEWDPEHAPENKEYAISKELGGIERQAPINPYGWKQYARDQWRTGYEAIGLRGFVASAIKQAFTGEQEIDEYTPVLQSAQDIETTRRGYWDENLGGLVGLTEPYRRFNPKRPYVFDYVNEIKNRMPDWLPGEDYYINFQTGDPFTKVSEGEYRLPGKGYEARYSELEGVAPEDYPTIHKYKILADVAMYSNQFKAARATLMTEDLTESQQRIFEETENQIIEKRKQRRFQAKDQNIDSPSLYEKYTRTAFDIARSSPLEQLLPLAPAHKLLPVSDTLKQYEETIYGKNFKLWQRPIDDFIKPFMASTAWAIGSKKIPSDVIEARKIEEYFDELKYVKFKRLENRAKAEGDNLTASMHRRRRGRTILGTDPYDHPTKIIGAMPKREREFFQEFIESKPEQREAILEAVPENLRGTYIAQWDKGLLQDIEEGKIDGSDQETGKVKQEILNRMQAIRSNRSKARQDVIQSSKLPEKNWIGWRADVDLEDIKLKYLVNTAKDYHYYDLWDDRLRALGRKPYLDEATDDIRPLEGLTDQESYADLLAKANEAGIENPQILMTPSTVMENKLDLEYINDESLRDYLRELGEIA